MTVLLAEPSSAAGVAATAADARRKRRPPAAVQAALGYLAVAVLVTIQTWTHPLGSWIGLVGDPEKFMSFLGWFPFAVTHGHNPLHISYIDLPTGINAMWDTTLPFAAYIVWPVRALFGVIAAYNVLIVGALMLDGLSTFLWLRRHTRHQLAAFIGGLMMVVGPYALVRTYGHLNLVLFFAMPLMFILVENIVREPRVRRCRRGLGLGALGAVQLLCSEEPLAVLAVTLLIALAIAAAAAPRLALARAVQMVPAGVAMLAGFLLVGGLPLAYQFFGPDVVHGPFQPHDYYVTDLLNLVVPTPINAVSVGGVGNAGSALGSWSGSVIEWDGYIGVPLLLILVFSLIRWRRDGWLLVVGSTTLALIVLSLGPHLHVNGVDNTGWPLPEALIDRLPVLSSILPNRFSLPIDFGLGAVLALFVDRVVFSARSRHRAVGVIATALVAAAMWPALVPSSTAYVPAYFQAGGDVAKVPQATAALVFPIPYVGSTSSTASALWQAVADFRFKMFSGASISRSATGMVGFGSPDQALRCVTDALQVTGHPVGCSTTPPQFLEELRALTISLVIVGPTEHLPEISAYFTALTGHQPQKDEGVLIWRV